MLGFALGVLAGMALMLIPKVFAYVKSKVSPEAPKQE
jgi:hypothetical protein